MSLVPRTSRRFGLPVMLAVLVVPAVPAAAQFGLGGGDAGKSAEQLVKVRVLADVPSITPGATFHVVVVFDIEPAWHIYWRNPGDSGLPTEVVVQAPQGFVVGPTRYVRPEAIKGPDGLNYGYEGRAALFVPVRAPDVLPTEAVTLTCDVSYLACRRNCLFGRAERTLRVPTGSTAARDATAEVPEVVRELKKRLPRPVRDVPEVRVEFDGRRLHVAGPAGTAERVVLFPAPSAGITIGAATSRVQRGRFELEAPVEIDETNALGEPLRLGGLIALGEAPDDPCYEFEVPLDVGRRVPEDHQRGSAATADAPRPFPRSN